MCVTCERKRIFLRIVYVEITENLRHVYVKILSLCALRIFCELRVRLQVISRIYIMLYDDYKMTVFLYLLPCGKLKNNGTCNFTKEIVLAQEA